MESKESPIEKSVELDLDYHTVSERYFTQYYFIPKKQHSKGLSNLKTDEKTETHLQQNIKTRPMDEATCVLMHSNRLCLVSISPLHAILQKKKKIIQIDFEISGINRLHNQVSGKRKRGGQVVGPNSVLCRLVCSDGTSYNICAGVKGKLVEVNERLLENPNLISEQPQAEGYLAVVLPSLPDCDKLKSSLLSREQYQQEIIQL